MVVSSNEPPGPPVDAYHAVAALPARMELLHLVLGTEEVTAREVMDALGLSRNTVGYHLSALVEAGLLYERRATHPRGSGPIIYWSANREAIHAVRDQISARLS